MDSPSETNVTKADTPNIALSIFNALFFNPVNLFLLIVICGLSYKIYKNFSRGHADKPSEMDLPKIRKDMTVEELRKYDGTQPDGRVLVAVNGWIFDATRGRRFYGPGGPYAVFGGKDASRGLATFSVTSSDKEYDDLSDLNSEQMDSVREWEAQFKEKYELVGRLLKPGDEPRNYSDEEPEETDSSTNNPADDKKEL